MQLDKKFLEYIKTRADTLEDTPIMAISLIDADRPILNVEFDVSYTVDGNFVSAAESIQIDIGEALARNVARAIRKWNEAYNPKIDVKT